MPIEDETQPVDNIVIPEPETIREMQLYFKQLHSAAARDMRNAHRVASGDTKAAIELLSSLVRQSQPVTDTQAVFATELGGLVVGSIPPDTIVSAVVGPDSAEPSE